MRRSRVQPITAPTVTIRLKLGVNALKRVKRAIVFEAVRACNGNKSQAARMLGIYRQSLRRMI